MADFMKLALAQAKIALDKGNLPVGAVLVIDGKYIGASHNLNNTNNNFNSHAESMLIGKHATTIRESNKAGKDITIYTTLEPCIMCFGTCVLNRIGTIIYACADSRGGACHIKASDINAELGGHWPKVKRGDLAEESFSLLKNFMLDKPNWAEVLDALEKRH